MDTPNDDGADASGVYAKHFPRSSRSADAVTSAPPAAAGRQSMRGSTTTVPGRPGTTEPDPTAGKGAPSARRREAAAANGPTAAPTRDASRDASGDTSAKRARPSRLLMTAAVVAAVAIVGVASITVLGRSSSSKFSSVAAAICASRVSGRSADAPIVPGSVTQVGCGGGYAAPNAATAGAGVSSSGAAGSSSGGPPLAASGPTSGASSPSASPSGASTSGASTSFGTNALDAPPPPGPAAAGHAFVSTATMTVVVEGDTAKAVAEQKRAALVIAANAGGGLFGEESTFDGAAKAVITLKVPSAQFTSVLDALAGLGTPKAQDVKTDEVTLQVVDLAARLTAAENGLERTRGLLAKATNLGDVAQLEADVNRRETEVENLRGQQAMLAQRVDLSTIVLTLVSSAPVAPPPPPPQVAAPAPPPGFLDGLGAGWGVFTKVGTFVLAGLGWALPFLPFVLAAALTWWLLRRRSRSRPTPAGPAGAAATG